MIFVNNLSWLGDKLEKIWDWFKEVVDKYIGSGFTAMLITIILVVVAIVVIRKFTSK